MRLTARAWIVLAWISGVGGSVILAAAFRWFVRTRQHPEPWKPSPVLIAHGIYRFTRNPMYLGMAGWQAAIGFWQRNLWMVGGIVASLAGVYYVAVRHEEAYLERRFGDAYREYLRTVRRWL